MARLTKLEVYNFRNIGKARIECDAKVVVLHGENAQGKTNLLEAVSVLSTLHSFRTRRLAEMIKQGEKLASIRGGINLEPGFSTLNVELERAGRSALIDGRNPTCAAEYLGLFPAVFFGPQDMDLAGANQLTRRRYLDRAAFNANPVHLENLRDYSRALKQLNEALRAGYGDLEVWLSEAARLGWKVHRARAETVEELSDPVTRIHRMISGGREQIDLRLSASDKDGAAGPEGLLEVLRRNSERDRERGFIKHGPQRDRLSVLLDGRELNLHGSQGQRRTAALSMKLALLEWTREKASTTPSFLLDDPGSELDVNRLEFLGSFLAQWEGQVFIASVDRNDVPLSGGVERSDFHVESGALTPA